MRLYSNYWIKKCMLSGNYYVLWLFVLKFNYYTNIYNVYVHVVKTTLSLLVPVHNSMSHDCNSMSHDCMWSSTPNRPLILPFWGHQSIPLHMIKQEIKNLKLNLSLQSRVLLLQCVPPPYNGHHYWDQQTCTFNRGVLNC